MCPRRDPGLKTEVNNEKEAPESLRTLIPVTVVRVLLRVVTPLFLSIMLERLDSDRVTFE